MTVSTLVVNGSYGISTGLTASAVTVGGGGGLTLSAGTMDLTGTGSVLINTGTFNATSVTLRYVGSGSDVAMNTAAVSCAALVISGASTNFNAGASLTVIGDATVAVGSLVIGANDFSVSGSVLNAGTITQSGGTTTVNGTAKSLGGAGSTSLNNLVVDGTYAASGTLSVGNNLTINSSKALSLAGNGLTVAGNVGISGTLDQTAGTVTVNGTDKTFGGSGTTRVFNLIIDGSVGSAGAVTVLNDVTVNSAKGLTMVGHDLTVSGGLAVNGTGVFNQTSTATTTLWGTNKTVGGGSATFSHLVVNGSYGAGGALTVTNDLTIPSAKSLSLAGNHLSVGGTLGTSGILNQTGGVLTLSGSNKTFGGSTTAVVSTLVIGGSYGLSGGLTAKAVSVGAGAGLTLGLNTVELNGTGAVLGGIGTVNGVGAALRYVGTGTDITLNASSMTCSAAVLSGTGATFHLGGNLSPGTLTLSTGTLALGSYDLSVTGSLVNNGVMTQSGGSATLSGASASSTSTFFNLVIGGVYTATGSLGVLNDLTVNSAQSLSLTGNDLSVGGRLSNSGTLDQTSGTVTVNGTDKTFGGSGTTRVFNLIIDGSVGSAGAITVLNDVVVNSAKGLTMVGHDLTVSGLLTVNGTFNQTSTATTTLLGTNKTVGGGTTTFSNLIVNGSYGAGGALTVTNDLTIPSAKSLSLAGNHLSVGGTLGTSGILNQTGGVLTLSGTNKSLGGSETVVASTLVVGGSYVMAGKVAAKAVIVSASSGLTLGANTLDLTGTGTVLTVTGNLNASSSTIRYIGTGAGVTVATTGVVYTNLVVSGAGTTFSVASGTVTVSEDLTIAAGTFDIDGRNLNVSGSIFNVATLTQTSGTTTMLGTNKTIGGSGTTSINNLLIGNGPYTATGVLSVNNLTVDTGGAAFQLSAFSFTLSGNGEIVGGSTLSQSGGSFVMTGANKFFGGTGVCSVYRWITNGTVTVTGVVTVLENIVVNTGGGLTLSGMDLTVLGGVGVDGALVQTAPGSATLKGSANGLGGAGTTNFYNLYIQGGYEAAGPVTVSNDVVIVSTKSLSLAGYNLTVGGNLSNSGTVDQVSAGSVIVTGSNKTIGGAGSLHMFNLTVDGVVASAGGFTLRNALIINSTKALTMMGHPLAVSGATTMGGTLAQQGGNAGLIRLKDVTVSENVTLAAHPVIQTTLTVSGGKTFSLGSSTLTFENVGAGLLSGTGSVDAGTSTVIFNGSGGSGTVSIPTMPYYHLTVDGSGKMFQPVASLTVAGDLTVANGAMNAGELTLTVGGRVSATGTLTHGVSGGLLTMTGSGKTIGGSGVVSLHNFTVEGSATLNGTVAVGNRVTVNGGRTLALGSSTLQIGGGGTPLVVNGTLEPGTGWIQWSSLTGATLAGAIYPNLSFVGAGTFRATSPLTVSGHVLVSGGALTFEGTSLTLAGTGVTLSAGGSGISGGDLMVSGTFTVGGTLSVGTVTVASGGRLTLGNASLTVTSVGQPITNSGVWAPGTSTVHYASVGGATVAAGPEVTYHHLVIDADGTFTPSGALTLSGDARILSGILVLGSTSLMSGGSLLGRISQNNSGVTTVTGLSQTLGGTEVTPVLGQLVISGDYRMAGGLTLLGDLTIQSGGRLSLASNTLVAGGHATVQGTLISDSQGRLLMTGANHVLRGLGFFQPGDLAIGGTYSLEGYLKLGRDLEVLSGKNFSLGSATLEFGGINPVFTNGGAIAMGTSTVIYSSSVGTGVLNLPYHHLTVGSVAGAFSSSFPLTCAGNFSIPSGTFNMGARDLRVGGSLLVSGLLAQQTPGITTLTGVGATAGGSGTVHLGDLTVGGSVSLTGTIEAAGVVRISTGASLNLGANTLVLAGSGTPLEVSGTLSAGTSTIKYAGSGGVIVPLSYYHLTVQGSAAVYSLTGPISCAGNLNVTAGTLAAGGQSLTLAGSFLVDGTFSQSAGGVVLLQGTIKDLGGTGSLTAQDMTVNGTYNLTGAITVNGTLNLPATQSLVLWNGTVRLGGASGQIIAGGPLVINTSTIEYLHPVGGTIVDLAYHHLILNGGSFLAAFDVGAAGNVTIAQGGLNVEANDLTVGGSLVVNGTLAQSNNGITTVSGSGRTIGGTGVMKPYDLWVNGTATLAGTVGVGNALMVTGSASLDLGTATLSLIMANPLQAGTSNLIPNQSTMVFRNASTVSVPMMTYYNLRCEGGMFIAGGPITVSHDFMVSSGTFQSSNVGLTIGGSATVNGELQQLGVSTGVVTGSGVVLSGSGTWRTYNFTVNGTPTLTQLTLIVGGGLQVSAGQTLSGGTGTIVLSGAGSPFTVTGAFVPQMSTVNYASATGAAVNGAVAYHHLGVVGSGTFTTAAALTCSGDVTIGSQAQCNLAGDWVTGGSLQVAGGLSQGGGTTTFTGLDKQITGTGAVVLKSMTVNGRLTAGRDVSVAGDFTVASGAGFTMNSGVTVTGRSTIQGTLVGSGSSSVLSVGGVNQSLSVSGEARLYSLRIIGAQTAYGRLVIGNVLSVESGGDFRAGTSTLIFTGSTTPIVNLGTFAAQSSTVRMSLTGARLLPALNYHHLVLDRGSYTLEGSASCAGTFTQYEGTLSLGGQDFSFGDTSVINGVVTADAASTMTWSGVNQIVGGTGALTVHHLTVSGSVMLTMDVSVNGNLLVLNGASLNQGTRRVTIGGSVTVAGAYVSGSLSGNGLTVLRGGANTIGGGGTLSMGDLSVTGTYALSSDLTCRNLFIVTGASLTPGNFNVIVTGNTIQALRFVVATSHAGLEVAGQPFSMVVTARDGADAVASAYAGVHALSWTFTATSGGWGTPTRASDGVVTFVSGVATVTGFVAYNPNEKPRVTVTDESGVTGTSSAFGVVSGVVLSQDVGGALSLPDGTGVEIPAGVLGVGETVVVTVPDAPPAIPTSHMYQSLPSPIIREFGIYDGTTGKITSRMLNGSASISIPYTAQAIGSVGEGTLRVFEYVGSGWILVGGLQTVDTAGKKVTARVTHFSYYALMAVQVKTTLNELKVYPNPYHPAQAVNGSLKFLNLPADISVVIYTLEGEVVKELRGADTGNTGLVEWDGRNQAGEAVARGVYFWRVLDGQGRAKTGKVALIR